MLINIILFLVPIGQFSETDVGLTLGLKNSQYSAQYRCHRYTRVHARSFAGNRQSSLRILVIMPYARYVMISDRSRNQAMVILDVKRMSLVRAKKTPMSVAVNG